MERGSLKFVIHAAMEEEKDRFRYRQAAEAIDATLHGKGGVFPEEAAAALESGNLIASIKLLRDANAGLGLKEAKDAVESLHRLRGKTGADHVRGAASNDAARVPTVVEGDRGVARSLLVIVFVVLAVAVWWLFSGRN